MQQGQLVELYRATRLQTRTKKVKSTTIKCIMKIKLLAGSDTSLPFEPNVNLMVGLNIYQFPVDSTLSFLH
jgi:hypothetical protein